MNVTRLEVTDDKAVSHLTTDERRLDKKTGGILSDRDAFHGVCLSLEWIKTGAGWKIEREVWVQEELAARIEEALSEQERDNILKKEKVFVTDTLVSSLTARCGRHMDVNIDLMDPDAAERCYQSALAVAEKIGDQGGIAAAWWNIGRMKGAQWEIEQALIFCQKSLELYETAKLNRGVAFSLQWLSYYYRVLGDNRQAFECAQKSLRLYEAEKHRRGMTDALSRLAWVYMEQNNPQQALAYLERALAIAQDLGDKFLIANLQNDISLQYRELGAHERALDIYQELLKQIEGFRDQGGAAVIRANIAEVLTAQGKHSEALDYYGQALAVFEASDYLKEYTVFVLNDISGVYLAQRKYAEALPMAERAVSLSRQTGWQLDLWLALTARGYAQLGLNRPLEARRSFAEAVSIIEKLRTQTAGGAEERQRYFEGRLRAHHGLLSLLVKENQTWEALVFAERAKARVLLDTLQQGRAKVQKAMTAEEQERERRLKSELTQLNTQLTHATQLDKPDSERISKIKLRLEKARLDHESFQDSLYAAHPELKVNSGEAPIINAEEL